ncbi:MAG: AIR synthase-related protein [Chloroflexi bacterium]|nr:AIR synthase-related protein [Chloroflexota bacterium]
MGKLPTDELKKLLKCIKKDLRVIVPPMIGYDAGVHLLDGKYVAVATDPCTGVPQEWFGWLLINYASSDVALFGAKPEFCTINLLGPTGTKAEVFQTIMKQTCRAADELGIAIVRGHTGMYGSLNDMLGVCTVYGTVEPEKLITPRNAKAGDLILCTKPLGYETITNFSLTHKEKAQKLFGAKKQQELAKQVPMQSCVKEALALAEVEGVHAMHDATEGGFVAALNELAAASNVGLNVTWDSIIIPAEVLALKAHFRLSDEQVLAMSSTGTILAAIKPEAKQDVTGALEKLGLSPVFIGQFTKNKGRALFKGKNRVAFPSQADDPYTMMLAKTTF